MTTKQGILWEQQNGICWLCDKSMRRNPKHLRDYSLDHMIPESVGGTRHISNLRLAHTRCNMLRGDASVSIAKQYVQLKLAGNWAHAAVIYRRHDAFSDRVPV